MKRTVILFLFALMFMGTTAHAYFEDIDISGGASVDGSARTGMYGAFYNITTTGGELALDLVGASDSFAPTASYSRSLLSTNVLSATASQTWSQVYFGGFAGARDGYISNIYLLGNTPDGSLDAGEYKALTNYSSNIATFDVTSTYWGGSASSADWTFTGPSTNVNSFFKKIDSNSGVMYTADRERINLSMWDTDSSYVYEMYLYGFNADKTGFHFDGSEPYGKMTLSLVDGNVNADYTAVPVPAAIWVLGSGLMGLLGFRKRFAA